MEVYSQGVLMMPIAIPTVNNVRPCQALLSERMPHGCRTGFRTCRNGAERWRRGGATGFAKGFAKGVAKGFNTFIHLYIYKWANISLVPMVYLEQ